MYKNIFLLHIKYKKKNNIYTENNCSGFEPSPIKLDK